MISGSETNRDRTLDQFGESNGQMLDDSYSDDSSEDLKPMENLYYDDDDYGLKKEHKYEKEINEIYTSLQVQGFEDIESKVILMKKRIFALSDKTSTSKNLIRRLVSKKKNRYNLDGADLDLTYITESIIAMGFPSSSTESVYRNPLKDVKRFLEYKHQNHYKIYNLCAEEERQYPDECFPIIKKCGFFDHHAPNFSMITDFCSDVVNIF